MREEQRARSSADDHETPEGTGTAPAGESRRRALLRLGLASTLAYATPTLLRIDRSANARIVPSPCVPPGSELPGSPCGGGGEEEGGWGEEGGGWGEEEGGFGEEGGGFGEEGGSIGEEGGRWGGGGEGGGRRRRRGGGDDGE